MDDWWWWWFLPLLLFHFLLCTSSFSFLHFPSSLGLSFAQRQPEEGWRGKERAASRGL